MIVADANVVIAATSPGHVHHDVARRLILDHGADGIVLHSLTLAEILVGPARVAQEAAVRRQLTAARIGVSPGGEPSPEQLARVRASSALKMPDACVLATAEHLGVGLATFDRRLAQEAVARGTEVVGLEDRSRDR